MEYITDAIRELKMLNALGHISTEDYAIRLKNLLTILKNYDILSASNERGNDYEIQDYLF